MGFGTANISMQGAPVTKIPSAVIALVLGSTVLGSMAAATANAAEIRVLSAGSLKLALNQLLPDFQKASGDTVTIDYGTAGAIVGRIQKGEPADVAIVSRSQLETLESQGKVAQGSRVNIAGVGVGVAIRKGAPKPDLSSVEAFKRALMSARSIGYVNPALGSSSGIYVAGMLERLGIAQDLKSKIRLVTVESDIDGVFQGVASGEIEMQIGQISEIAISPGVELAGPLPSEIQNFTLLAAGVVAAGKAPEPARAFIKFIAAPAAALVLKANGFQPG
jgi:molybdate transport system substrate-binding protein